MTMIARRIVLRQTSRCPLRSLVTSLGIALSVAVLIVSMQWLDAEYRTFGPS